MAAVIGKITGRLVFFPGMTEEEASRLTAGHDVGEVDFALNLKTEPVKRDTIPTSLGDLPRPRGSFAADEAPVRE